VGEVVVEAVVEAHRVEEEEVVVVVAAAAEEEEEEEIRTHCSLRLILPEEWVS
jgi:ribosomal protein S19